MLYSAESCLGRVSSPPQQLGSMWGCPQREEEESLTRLAVLLPDAENCVVQNYSNPGRSLGCWRSVRDAAIGPHNRSIDSSSRVMIQESLVSVRINLGVEKRKL
ncbi:hypothetical protein IF1G_01131 [Cordyceps javanica]|uniref:Uncharacterized protein n=1 Tax=Cordyceps javanica TaxID=43265 RepID=A0A545VHT0_9HYPO|nr:hypothetical protein IF1G_01131 [Cordyceps javanica]